MIDQDLQWDVASMILGVENWNAPDCPAQLDKAIEEFAGKIGGEPGLALALTLILNRLIQRDILRMSALVKWESEALGGMIWHGQIPLTTDGDCIEGCGFYAKAELGEDIKLEVELSTSAPTVYGGEFVAESGALQSVLRRMPAIEIGRMLVEHAESRDVVLRYLRDVGFVQMTGDPDATTVWLEGYFTSDQLNLVQGKLHKTK